MKQKILLPLFIFMAVFFCLSEKSIASAKVSIKVQKGTCYVTGSGEMKKNQILPDKKKAKIKKLVLGKGVTSIPEGSFSGCKNMTSVKISKTVKKLGPFSFAGSKIRTLTIPNTVKYLGEDLFSNCKKLKKVKMPGKFWFIHQEDPDSSITILNSKSDTIEQVTFTTDLDYSTPGMIFCNNLFVKKKDARFVSVDGVVYTKDKKVLVRVPSLRESIETIKECEIFPFAAVNYGASSEDDYGGLINLKKIVLGSNIKKIEDEKYYESSRGDETFQGTLEEIVIQTKLLSEKDVTKLYEFFQNKKVIAKSLSDAGYMELDSDGFLMKDSLLKFYMGKAKKIEIPDKVTEIGEDAFSGQKLTSVVIGKNVKTIGENAFSDNEKLKTVTLNEGLETIGNGAFRYTGIEEIQIPSTVTTIGEFAFGGTELKEINIPDTVKTIGQNAFYYNKSLKKAVLPESMTVVPDGIFSECPELSDVTLSKETTEIEAWAFNECPKIDIQKILDYPKLKYIRCIAFYGVPFKKLTIPSHIEVIEQHAFYLSSVHPGYKTKKTVTMESFGTSLEVESFHMRKLTFVFPDDFSKTYTEIMRGARITGSPKNKFIKKTFFWHKVEGAEGYQIKVYDDKKCKKLLKTVNVNKNENKRVIGVYYKDKNRQIFVKIRPKKKVKGKTVYGKWSKVLKYGY